MFTILFFTFSYVLEKFHNQKLEENKTEEKKIIMQSMKYNLVLGVSGCVRVLGYNVMVFPTGGQGRASENAALQLLTAPGTQQVCNELVVN